MEQRIRELYNESILNNALSYYNIEKNGCRLLDGFESYVYQIEMNNEQFILKISHSIRRDMTLPWHFFIHYPIIVKAMSRSRMVIYF